jgi:hypothetical protein
MVNIVLKSIPAERQRYDTSGDYWWSGDTLQVRVTRATDWRYDMPTGVHEIVEASLTRGRGISREAIDAFDFQFEADRQAGVHSVDEEPGNDPRAPYFKEPSSRYAWSDR